MSSPVILLWFCYGIEISSSAILIPLVIETGLLSFLVWLSYHYRSSLKVDINKKDHPDAGSLQTQKLVTAK